MMARATARVARTIPGCPCYTSTCIVRATLAVALAVQLSSWQSFTNPGTKFCIGETPVRRKDTIESGKSGAALNESSEPCHGHRNHHLMYIMQGSQVGQQQQPGLFHCGGIATFCCCGAGRWCQPSDRRSQGWPLRG